MCVSADFGKSPVLVRPSGSPPESGPHFSDDFAVSLRESNVSQISGLERLDERRGKFLQGRGQKRRHLLPRKRLNPVGIVAREKMIVHLVGPEVRDSPEHAGDRRNFRLRPVVVRAARVVLELVKIGGFFQAQAHVQGFCARWE